MRQFVNLTISNLNIVTKSDTEFGRMLNQNMGVLTPPPPPGLIGNERVRGLSYSPLSETFSDSGKLSDPLSDLLTRTVS